MAPWSNSVESNFIYAWEGPRFTTGTVSKKVLKWKSSDHNRGEPLSWQQWPRWTKSPFYGGSKGAPPHLHWKCVVPILQSRNHLWKCWGGRTNGAALVTHQPSRGSKGTCRSIYPPDPNQLHLPHHALDLSLKLDFGCPFYQLMLLIYCFSCSPCWPSATVCLILWFYCMVCFKNQRQQINSLDNKYINTKWVYCYNSRSRWEWHLDEGGTGVQSSTL